MKRYAEEVTSISDEFKSTYADAKMLVAGGAGFLGSWLAEILVACGASVHCLDNFSAGQIRNISSFKNGWKLRGLLLLGSSRGKDGQTFNVGRPDEITVRTLADNTKDFTRSGCEIRHMPAREDDSRGRSPDLRKMHRLGRQPTMSLRSGLLRTIAHFREASHS